MNPIHRASLARPTVRTARRAERQVTLCEVLDRVLNKGVVLTGEVMITVADIDLLYVGLNVILSSVETMRESKNAARGAHA